MIISQVIEMLEKAKKEYGDLPVYIDIDYGQRLLEEDNDPLCKCPSFEEGTVSGTLPDRIIL